MRPDDEIMHDAFVKRHENPLAFELLTIADLALDRVATLTNAASILLDAAQDASADLDDTCDEVELCPATAEELVKEKVARIASKLEEVAASVQSVLDDDG